MKTTMNCPEGATITVECACPENEVQTTTEDEVQTTTEGVVPEQSKVKQRSTEMPVSRAKRHIPKTLVEDWTESWLNKTDTFKRLSDRDGFTTNTIGYNVYKHVATTSISAMRKLVRQVKELKADLEASEESAISYEAEVCDLTDLLDRCAKECEANETEIRDLKSKTIMFADGVKMMQKKIKKLEARDQYS